MITQDTSMMVRQAEQVRRIAEDMSRINNVSLLGAAESVAAVWRGDAANAYLQHCATTRDHIRKTVGELQNIADSIERVARELEAAQMVNATQAATAKVLKTLTSW